MEQPMLEMYYTFVFMCCGSFAGIILIGFIAALWGKDSTVTKVVLIFLCMIFLFSMVVIITPLKFLETVYRWRF